MQANARLGFDVIRGESWVVVFFTFSNFDWILSRWNISSSRPRLDFYQELIQFSDWARRSKGVEKHECFVEDCTINMDLLNLEYRFLRKVFLERENIWFDSIWNLECRFVLSRRWIKTEWSSRIETDIKITKTCATFRWSLAFSWLRDCSMGSCVFTNTSHNRMPKTHGACLAWLEP